jgi:cytochrome c553
MKVKTIWIFLSVSLVSSILIVGCFSSSSSTSSDSGIYFPIDGVNYAGITVDEAGVEALDPGARLLASQCAQCHGTFGVAVKEWPDLWGGGRQISNWMINYQVAETYSDDMMHLHALAYTVDEVNLLKSYYPEISYDSNATGE